MTGATRRVPQRIVGDPWACPGGKLSFRQMLGCGSRRPQLVPAILEEEMATVGKGFIMYAIRIGVSS
jgi:hypothetical protein